MRAGSFALSLLAEPLQVQILTVLRGEPLPAKFLDRSLPCSESASRRHLRKLTAAGVLDSERPDNQRYELTDSGQDLLAVAGVLRTWLEACPNGPNYLGTPDAKVAVKAMIDGWSLSILRALAARALGLTDLNKLISGVSYATLERRLAGMRHTGQIFPCHRGGGVPYTVGDWLRHGVAPITAAARWERLHLPTATPPVDRIDSETAFLLVVPTLEMQTEISGSCRLAMKVKRQRRVQMAGVVAEIADGRVVTCSSRLQGNPAASASGTADAWLGAVADRDPGQLRAEGRADLASAVVTALHDFLFPPSRPDIESRPLSH